METDVQAVQEMGSGIPRIVTPKLVCSELDDQLARIAAREAALTPEARAERERRDAEREAVHLEHERRQAAEERQRFVDQFGSRYAGCRLDNFVVTCDEQQKAVDALREYGKTFGQHYRNGEGVVLFGPPGTGKDHLATGSPLAFTMPTLAGHGKRFGS